MSASSPPVGGRSFLDKVWDRHRVAALGAGQDLVAIDRLILHDLTGAEVLQQFARQGRTLAPGLACVGVVDHLIDTSPHVPAGQARQPAHAGRIALFRAEASRLGLLVFDIGDPRQGISHVVAAETGIALPGTTLVCGDSHTSTLGGLGALAWGIGSSDAEYVLATGVLRRTKPRSMRVTLSGTLSPDVTAKDVVMALIARLGVDAGIGFAAEFAGTAIRALDVEARMTLCNMAIEFSAKYGFVAPDDRTIEYVARREFAPRGADWDCAVGDWRGLSSDADATFDAEAGFDCAGLKPQVSWGTSLDQVIDIESHVPAATDDPARRALAYMDLSPGTAIAGLPIDAAFIGSCTNARISDLRIAARLLQGRTVAPGVRAYCVPGSSAVRRQAEAEGLDRIFTAAGFEWHGSGCSMCAGGRDSFLAGRRVISTTNRNFEHRQGPGTRTHVASPATVAASAVLGRIADPRAAVRP